MPRTKPLRLLIGLRLRDPASAPVLRAADAFLEEAASLETGFRLPLAWNLPLSPLEDNKSRAATDLATEINSRVRARSDAILLMGYSGAPHPLLAAEELNKELSWCRRNPWGPAARALLGQEPQHLLPVAADLLREELEGVYARHGFTSVGLPEPLEQALTRLGPGRDAYRFAGARRPGRAVLYPAWVLPPGVEPKAIRAAAGIAGRHPLFLLLEPGDGPLLGPLLQALGTRFEPQFLTLEEALAGEAPEATDPPAADPLPLLTPAALESTSRAEALRARARRRTDADIRAVLEALGSSAARPRAAARLREAKRRRAGEGPTLVAAMGGLVALEGAGFAATFTDGRLSGLRRQGRQLLCGQPADSYLVAGGRRLRLITESAFSFEQGQDSGLRTVLKAGLSGGEVQLVMHACFREGREELELGFTVSFPELSSGLRLEAVVPLELAVFALAHGERAKITAELAGGGDFSATLAAGEGERLFTCSRLLLERAGGGPGLVFSPGAPSGVLVLPVRVARSRRGWHLLASPFGAHVPAPAGLYSGRTLSFSLRLSLEG